MKCMPGTSSHSVAKGCFYSRNGGNGRVTPRIRPIDGASDFLCPSTSSRCDVMKKASLISTRNGVAATEGEAELARLLPDMWARISTCNQRRDASHEEDLDSNPVRSL